MRILALLKRPTIRLMLIAAFVLPLIAGFATPALAAGDHPQAVYMMTNSTAGNQVAVFQRAGDGSLASPPKMISTGGLGTGAALGSQGSVVLSPDGRWLFVVNAGSNQVSVFAVLEHGLKLTDVANSGGVMPISVTEYEHVLYVLNAGGSGNITGFRLSDDGTLKPLAGSTQPLSNGGTGASPAPAEVSFASGGHELVVTEKATNLIDTYVVHDGIARHMKTHPSSGATPFGFAAVRGTNLVIVSEAVASTLSSYRVTRSAFQVISASVPTTQAAACWVVISKNRQFAYDTNAASGSISSFRIGSDGSLTLQEAQAGLTGAGSSPQDMAITYNGNFLYAMAFGTSKVLIFRLHTDGDLDALGDVSVPAGSFGLAAN